ncbi:hypothetical protein [Roseomonas sp. KE0001]|uniref:hypothetical protein n=1 Tax=Roseomonas sp. KE0001 TaxID=2479201 RepID=UPI0018E00569|nr:hypothetical protein [Roseomonas sp. KE0001]MBI0433295.1 hypothetical protein [Roseomonas sp. KE0001]
MPRPSIVIESDSREAVALALLQLVLRAEDAPRDAAGILAAYRDCLDAVRGPAQPLAAEPLALEEEEPASIGEEDAAPRIAPPPPRRRKPRKG